MKNIKKGVFKAPKVVEEDPFFLKLPTPTMLKKMQDTVNSFFLQMQADGTIDKATNNKSQIVATIAEYFKEQKFGGWKNLKMKHSNLKKYKIYHSLYDMVIHKIKAFSNTSKPTDKDCLNSNPNEEEKSDSLN
jgi:hypothetical protein